MDKSGHLFEMDQKSFGLNLSIEPSGTSIQQFQPKHLIINKFLHSAS